MHQVKVLLLATTFFSLLYVSRAMIHEAYSPGEENGLCSGEGFNTSNKLYKVDQQKLISHKSENLDLFYLSHEDLFLRTDLLEESSSENGLEQAGPKPRHVVKSLAAGI